MDTATTTRHSVTTIADTIDGGLEVKDRTDIDVLHEIGSRIAAADPLHVVLSRVVEVVSRVVPCDSCFVYVLEEDDLVLFESGAIVLHIAERFPRNISARIWA